MKMEGSNFSDVQKSTDLCRGLPGGATLVNFSASHPKPPNNENPGPKNADRSPVEATYYFFCVVLTCNVSLEGS